LRFVVVTRPFDRTWWRTFVRAARVGVHLAERHGVNAARLLLMHKDMNLDADHVVGGRLMVAARRHQ
jgi:hypothetical protein